MDRTTTAVTMDLTSRVALVTGSTGGIGNAIARRLYEAGATVIVNGRDERRVADAAAALDTDGTGRAWGIAADVTAAEESARLIREAGPVDVLVNNFGEFGAVAPLEITDDQWRRIFEANVLSAIRLIRMVLPTMREQLWGRVISIASESAVATPVEMIHYGMSKTALLAVTRGFAKEAAGSAVTVNTVVAGPTRTAGVEAYVRTLVGGELSWSDAERKFIRRYRPDSLIRRLLDPLEVANLVLYLASPLASGTTGGALRVDGGVVDAILP